MIHTIAATTLGLITAQPLPEVTVNRDNFVIDRSCRVVIPEGTVIADTDGNGVIHVRGSDIVVEFAPGSVLSGAGADTPWSEFRGTGIRIQGQENVTLRGVRVRGFWAGVHATGADGLVVEDSDLSDNYRQRLRSTPIAEEGGDWLSPHHNDNNEWLTRYGAAMYIEDSEGVTVRRVHIRRGQNGILLDRVNNSRIYDNDASFLSGWGLGLWRSSGNTITRNALDFCVRGHVEGVYNRGQDSAGILMFEQCNENIIAENSATRGGDGFFGFAGLEAIGEREPIDGEINYARVGCNDNLLIDNDFSYAPAHGIEMTFSEGNMFIRNRLVENAICGVWGGYSSDTLIALNLFEGNGGMAYGLERGGVNIEHGSGNHILSNTFRNNMAGIHMWWDPDDGPTRLPGVKAAYRGVSENVIAYNSMLIDENHPFTTERHRNATLIGLQFRDDGEGNVRDNLYLHNSVWIDIPNAREFALKEGTEPATQGSVPQFHIPEYEVLGETRPVGARKELRGRDKIIMDEWGPWDHASPMMRARERTSRAHVFDVFGVEGAVVAQVLSGNVQASADRAPQNGPAGAATVRVSGGEPGVHPYKVRISGAGFDRTVAGTFVGTTWNVRVWSWTTNPLEDLEGWRREAEGDNVFTAEVDSLHFPYGFGGPRAMRISEQITREGPGNDRFGMVATTTIPLTRGAWRIRTLSDDGVRVFVDGRQVIERWNIHGPTPDQATFTVENDREVEIKVEHFENDGYAMLTFEIEAAE